jgi:hypothetical protein
LKQTSILISCRRVAGFLYLRKFRRLYFGATFIGSCCLALLRLSYRKLRRLRSFRFRFDCFSGRLQLILPIVFFVIFLLLYMVFHSVTEAAVLIFPTIYALTGGLILQRLLGYNFSVAVTRSFRGARTRRRAISPAGSRRNSVIPDSDPSEPTKQ